MANRDFRKAVLDAIRTLPNYKTLSYLELGCGDGFILEALRKEGVANARGTTYRARGEDYIRTRDYPEGVEVDYGIDLNQSLPYPVGSFDVVYSTEVIEHVEGHRNFITQAARVLRPGGSFILTTPNLHRLLSRINFALSGVHLTKQKVVPWDAPLGQMEEFHHRCVDFPLLHWLMWKGGLRVQDVQPTEVHRSSRLAATLLRPLIGRPTKKHVWRHATAGNDEDRRAREDLTKWMLSPALLCSEQMCVIAKKTN
jgi:SAM-dependent methyltransferase